MTSKTEPSLESILAGQVEALRQLTETVSIALTAIKTTVETVAAMNVRLQELELTARRKHGRD